MLTHGVALRLGKTLTELDAMPYEEFLGWIAFFELTGKPDA